MAKEGERVERSVINGPSKIENSNQQARASPLTSGDGILISTKRRKGEESTAYFRTGN